MCGYTLQDRCVLPAAADPARLGVITAVVGRGGPALCYTDLRRGAGAPTVSSISSVLAQMSGPTATPSSGGNVDAGGLAIRQVAMCSSGGIYVVMIAGGACLLGAFIGGPELIPLSAWKC